MVRSARVVLRLDGLEATPKQIDESLKLIERGFKHLMGLPEKKRKTLSTRKRLLRLQMLKGYFEGLKRVG
jgi:hypothetical protein